MATQPISFARKGALVAMTLLVMAPGALAGEHAHGGLSTPRSSVQPASAPVARPTAVSITVTPPTPAAADPVSVDLRGPDGQIRRFPVEGGRAAIQTSQVVIRAGESVTIRWMAAK